jgi:4-amino-4-deoxy-L-arabinose transferase-like glycosyltransferase
MEKTAERSRTIAWLLLIILLGLGIRMAGLAWGQGYSVFASTDSLEAYRFTVDYARGETRAQYIGQPNYNEHSKLPGPLWTIFCYAGLRLWGSIEGVIVATVLLNTATIYLIYLLAKRVLGHNCSLWAALLAATLPFPVYYSDFVYNPNVMPFFGALVFLALWEVVRKDRSRGIFWVMFLLLIMAQFHLSVLSLLPAIVIILALSSVRLNVPWLIGGALAGILCYVPYVRGEMAHRWQNTLGMGSGRNGHWWGGLKAIIAPWNLLVNYVPQWTRGAEDYRQLGKACFGSFGALLILNILSGLIAAFLLVGISREIRIAMRGFWQSPRQAFSRAPGVLFFAILTTVPLFCSLVSRQSFHARYSIILLAPLLTLAGLAVTKWLAWQRIRRPFLAAMIAMTCGNIWFMLAMYHDQDVRITQSDIFYSSFRNLEIVYQELKQHAGAAHGIKVDDAAYLASLSPDDRYHHDAKLIRRYVEIREKETGAAPGSQTASVTFTLCAADQTKPGDAAIAYKDHGIALIAGPHSP